MAIRGKKSLFVLSVLLALFSVPAKADCINVALGTTGRFFCLEVADTDRKREMGLQGRRYLEKNGGMLFVFPDDAPRVIWMKNTLVTLDIIFLDNEGVIKNLAARVSPSRIKLFSSARYIIELPGGTSEELDLWPGDKVMLPI